MSQYNFFGIDNQLKRLSDLGDQLETLGLVVDFEVFRPELVMAMRRGDGSKGGRPPYDVVTMFKILVIQAMNDCRMNGLNSWLMIACRSCGF